MLLPLLTIGLLLCVLAGVALLVVRQEQHRHRTEELASAVLATVTAEKPPPPGPAPARVLDARSLTDEELMAEVLRRNGGRHEEQA
jgi:hypothetical protein